MALPTIKAKLLTIHARCLNGLTRQLHKAPIYAVPIPPCDISRGSAAQPQLAEAANHISVMQHEQREIYAITEEATDSFAI